MKKIIRRVKQSSPSKKVRKLLANIPDIRNLPKDVVLSQYSNQIKLRQLEWIEKGSPITEEELIAGIKKEWKLTQVAYLGAGIALSDLIEAGKEAITHPEDATPLPKPVQWLVKKTGRNVKCPCGSGKKHKKCCGR